MKIKELTIYTGRLHDQKQFYSETLGLTILSETENEVLFKIGNSNLKIVNRETSTPYHFAFNIPSNQDEEALEWLKSRVGILKMEGNEIQDFDDWNARAIYFYDLDNNIVEFIARKNLNYKSMKYFDQNSLLEISEIGIPTEDIEREYNILNGELGLSIYDGGFDKFCAIGKETGLFICINKRIKGWFPLNDKAYSSDFRAKLTVSRGEFQIEYMNAKIKTEAINA